MRRMDTIFKTMELFVGTRQAEQCRSHHQKMQKKYLNFITIVSNLRQQHYNTLEIEPILQDMASNLISLEEELATIYQLRLQGSLDPILTQYKQGKRAQYQRFQRDELMMMRVEKKCQVERQEQKMQQLHFNVNMLDQSNNNIGQVILYHEKDDKQLLVQLLLQKRFVNIQVYYLIKQQHQIVFYSIVYRHNIKAEHRRAKTCLLTQQDHWDLNIEPNIIVLNSMISQSYQRGFLFNINIFNINIFNIIILFHMVINLYLFWFFIITIFARQQIWIRYNAYLQQFTTFQRYFHQIRDGYFVDLGGYNPIHFSNTVKLSNWKGLIAQANQGRSNDIRDYQPDITVLNIAVNNVSGSVTFYESYLVIEASSLSAAALIGRPYIQQKAMALSLADLCHQYYVAKPTIMNIDLEGIGESVLRSNDWTTDKCIPDIIYAQDSPPNQKTGQVYIEQVAKSHGYTYVQKVDINKIFILNEKVEFYKKQVQSNLQYLKNKKIYNWDLFANDLTKLLGKNFNFVYNARTTPAYVQIRQPSIIDIVEINTYSNLVSEAGQNRPIIILEYDEQRSGIYLGTNKFTTETVTVNQHHFQKITADYQGKKLQIFIYDHQKYESLNLKFVEPKQSQTYFQNKYQNSFNYAKQAIKSKITNITMISSVVVVLFIALLVTIKCCKGSTSNDLSKQSQQN